MRIINNLQPDADYGQPGTPPGGSARDPVEGPTPAVGCGMEPDGVSKSEPDGVCVDMRCPWNAEPDAGERLLRKSLGWPDGWKWPHHHDGPDLRAAVLHIEIG